MDAGKIAGREISLVIELAAGSAVVNGNRIEISPTEFTLLATLAARPGEVVSHKELAAVAFGEGIPVTPHDLHWRIWNLRVRIGDRDRKRKLIENRRGQGYILHLPEASVKVLEGKAQRAVASSEPAAQQVIHLDEPPPLSILPQADSVSLPADDELVLTVHADDPDSLSDSAEVSAAAPEAVTREDPSSLVPSRRMSLRPRAVLLATTLAITALGSSWSVGYLLSSRSTSSEQHERAAVPPADPSPVSEASKPKDDEKKPRKRGDRGKQEARNSHKGTGQEGRGSAPSTVAAAPLSSSDGEFAPADQPTSQPKDSDKNDTQAAPALPAAPTRYLYHLVHVETGDHFVTTDGNTASEYEAQGYRGSAIARVYTSQERGTKAITTNQGTAWIFVDRASRTEPSSQVVPLWYSTNNTGDFFYTISESEARASGWNASLIGYVRSL